MSKELLHVLSAFFSQGCSSWWPVRNLGEHLVFFIVKFIPSYTTDMEPSNTHLIVHNKRKCESEETKPSFLQKGTPGAWVSCKKIKTWRLYS